MKKTLYAIIASLAALSNTTADGNLNCENSIDTCCYTYENTPKHGLYLGAFGGLNFLNATGYPGNHLDFKTGYVLSAHVGYRFCTGIRLEGEYAYRNNALDRIRHFDFTNTSISGFHIQTSSLMGNLIWDLPVASWGLNLCSAQPFVGGGMGCDFVEARYHGRGLSKGDHFSWQLLAGVSYPVTCNMDLSVEYKYHQVEKLYNNTVGVGLKYYFGS